MTKDDKVKQTSTKPGRKQAGLALMPSLKPGNQQLLNALGIEARTLKRPGDRSRSEYGTTALRGMAHAMGVNPYAILLQFTRGYVVRVNPETGEKRYIEVSVGDQLQAASTAIKYLSPTLKGIEVTGAEGGPLQVAHTFADLAAQAETASSMPVIDADAVAPVVAVAVQGDLPGPILDLVLEGEESDDDDE
jgi:hypothetical protein